MITGVEPEEDIGSLPPHHSSPYLLSQDLPTEPESAGMDQSSYLSGSEDPSSLFLVLAVNWSPWPAGSDVNSKSGLVACTAGT